MRRQFVTFTCRGLVQSFCRDSHISNKISEQDWEDQSPLSDNTGMDMSPSPWNKRTAPVAKDDDDDISADEALLALQNLDLSDFQKMQALQSLQAKNKALEEQLATITAGSPVTPAPSIAKAAVTSGDGKYKNGARHLAVLNNTKSVIADLDVLAFDQCALWWCKVHLDELMSEDKPACYPSYKLHAKKASAEALFEDAQ